MIVDGEECYGKELVLDLHDCIVDRFNRENIKKYFELLCDDVIDMEREDLHFWDDEGIPEGERRTEPHVVGITAVQFILTSNVTIHALTLLKKVFVNVFSCKEFDADNVTRFTQQWFGGRVENSHVVKRR